MIKERSRGAHPRILTGDDLIAHDREWTNVTWVRRDLLARGDTARTRTGRVERVRPP
jgi:hypothetical protein